MITKRGESVKDCHKSGEIWENYDPRGNGERAVKNGSLSVKSGVSVSEAVAFHTEVTLQRYFLY